VIVKGDTLLAIALKYGINLEDLLAANPEVDPHFLTIGKTLVIPLKGEDPASLLTPTPVRVSWEEPYCYPDASSGLWCFLFVQNDQSYALENLSGWISLISPDGRELAGQAVYPMLNLLPSGHAMPLVAFFPGPVPVGSIPRGDLLTALRVRDRAARYIPVEIETGDLTIEEDELQAHVSGQLSLPIGSPPAKVVWLLAVAYNAEGRVVGIRKWEANSACLGMQATAIAATTTPAQMTLTPVTGCLSFVVDIFSLGPPIDHIDILTEARP
jgi:LysM repeat protein